MRTASGRPTGPGASRPTDREGWWRLSTARAYACHMGDLPEPWMHEEVERGASAAAPTGEPATLGPARRPWPSVIPRQVRASLVARLKKSSLYPMALKLLADDHAAGQGR